MSKGKDRARAESGTIFRDGKYVNKEEWYAAHPTLQMLKERQARVDAEIDRCRVEETVARQAAIKSRYYCTLCRKHHVKPSKVWHDHTSFILEEGGI